MAGRGLVSFVCKSWKKPFLKPKTNITSTTRNVNIIKGRCNGVGYNPPVCENPCSKKRCGPPPRKAPPCPRRKCFPPVHMCPYDDPCFHCPYTPPPCPKKKDACCKSSCCPPYNPWKYRDICCLPRHPDRILNPKCPDHCKIKKPECCPCCVCREGPLKEENQHNTLCCPAKPPQKLHCCAQIYDKRLCPTVPECERPKCVERCDKIPCIKQRGTNSCDTK